MDQRTERGWLLQHREHERVLLGVIVFLGIGIAMAAWNLNATSLTVPDGYVGVAVSEEGEVTFLEPGKHAYIKEENRTAYMVPMGKNATVIRHCMHSSWMGKMADLLRGNAWTPAFIGEQAGKWMEEKQVKQMCTRMRMDYTLDRETLHKLAHTAKLGDFENMIFIPNLRGAFERAMTTVKDEQSGGLMADAWRLVRRADEPELDVDKARQRLYDLMNEDASKSLNNRFGLNTKIEVLDLAEVTVAEEIDLSVMDSAQVEVKHETSAWRMAISFVGKVITFALIAAFVFFTAPFIMDIFSELA